MKTVIAKKYGEGPQINVSNLILKVCEPLFQWINQIFF